MTPVSLLGAGCRRRRPAEAHTALRRLTTHRDAAGGAGCRRRSRRRVQAAWRVAVRASRLGGNLHVAGCERVARVHHMHSSPVCRLPGTITAPAPHTACSAPCCDQSAEPGKAGAWGVQGGRGGGGCKNERQERRRWDPAQEIDNRPGTQVSDVNNDRLAVWWSFERTCPHR